MGTSFSERFREALKDRGIQNALNRGQVGLPILETCWHLLSAGRRFLLTSTMALFLLDRVSKVCRQ